MDRKLIYYLLFHILLFIPVSCISDNPEESEGGNIGVDDLLPSFSVVLSGGTIVTDQSLEGKVSVILLFSVTCPDCRALFPGYERLYQQLKMDEDVVILGISRAENEVAVGSYWEENGLTFPYSPQEDRSVYSLFARSGVPRIYVSDRNKIVRFMYDDDPVATYEELYNAVMELIEQ